VEQLLDPYIDRQLRVNKLRAQIAWPAGMPTATNAEFAGEVNEAGECGAE
jgi:phosphoketolase